MNTEKARKVAEEFVHSLCAEAGKDYGTEYADGGRDGRFYFESEGGQHVTVHYYHVSDSYHVSLSDGVVW